jgi:hypothetical protein
MLSPLRTLRRPRAAARHTPLRLEELEGRLLPSTFTVVNTSDSGLPASGSLRRALIDSNATPGPNVIQFAIPGAGVHTVSPFSPLPAVTHTVLIDGTTQPGFVQANAPQIFLDGTNAGANVSGLTLMADGCTVRGLAIGHFTSVGSAGIDVESSGNMIVANFLGTDAAGTLGNAVQGNNSSFNAGAGVMVSAGAAGNSVGGAAPGQGNTLALNGQAGAWVDGPATTGVPILGNSIFGNGGLGGIALTNGGDGSPFGPPPALAYAFSVGAGGTTAVGTLQAAANTTYRVEFFDSPGGGGQGQTFLGFLNVTTDASGSAAFADDFAGALTSLTATSTGPNNNTSPFSAPVAVAHL